ncbi:hypothetical protein, partial [Streptomyces sp. OR43]|uniref:hypothetical protein n=1 Tax=Streptomyces sp. or43 TaxID=2478957 RepID=UPI001C9C59FD
MTRPRLGGLAARVGVEPGDDTCGVRRPYRAALDPDVQSRPVVQQRPQHTGCLGVGALVRADLVGDA